MALMDRADLRPLAALTAGFATAFAVYGLFRHWSFGTSYDLGIFDQVVWHLSRFETPASTLSGFGNVLGDHFYPILVLFAPLYWVAPAPETLIGAQGVLIAASIVPVFLFLRMRLPRGAAYLLATAYVLFWGIQRAIGSDVHEIAFAPLVIATAVLAMETRRWGLFNAMALLLVCVKEDLIPLLGGFGLYLMLRGDRGRGLAMIAVSVIVLAVVVGVAVPALSGVEGSTYVALYRGAVEHPTTILRDLVVPTTKVRTIVLWFLPFLFLSLASPLSVLVPTVALSRLLSDNPNHWGTTFHYSAPLAPLLAMSAGDGLARLRRRFLSDGARSLRLTVGAATVVLVLCAFVPGRLPLWRVFAPRHYRAPVRQPPARDALALIPPDASVVAQAAIVPHLSQRRTIFVLERKPADAEYVIAADDLNPWPSASVGELRALLEEKRQRGYIPIFERDGWIVLRAPTQGRQASPTR
jgi:uncharacterized membrane protein